VERRQVRLREVAVVVRGLLDSHPIRLATLLGPAAGLLDECLAGIEDGGLALDLERDRPLHGPERVHVLDLDLGPERLRPPPAERHVRLDPQLAALHVGVRRADRADPAEHRLDPGDELLDAEGLHQVVITAKGEAAHLFLDCVARGQEHDRDLHAACTETTAHLEAVKVSQHHVEEQQVLRRGVQRLERLPAVADGLDFEVVVAEGRLEHRSQVFLVLDEEQVCAHPFRIFAEPGRRMRTR
jgi:hypothetical protein